MLDPARTTLVFGPPGTGKTTYLIQRVEDALNRGTSPDRIGYVSFTVKATEHARNQACAKFNLSPSALPWFRTLHSLAYRQTGVQRAQVMSPRHLREFGTMIGVEIDGYLDMAEGGQLSTKRGDRMSFIDQLARVRMRNLEDEWRLSGENTPFFAVERFSRMLAKYKHERGLIDFTDMLVNFCSEGAAPSLDLLCVDEAQDLSTLQWRAIDRLASKAGEAIIAGDDDQAIYRWAGADVEAFIQLRGKEHPLTQSHRVPIEVQKVAKQILAKIMHRRQKTWHPRNVDGMVQRVGAWEAIDMSQGTWLVLARNRYQLEAPMTFCRENGWLFELRGDKSFDPKVYDAIRTWEELRSGKACAAYRVKAMVEFLSAKGMSRKGKAGISRVEDGELLTLDLLRKDFSLRTTEIWHQSLDMVSSLVREYLVAALRRGERLGREPRIRLSTIHGAKGGEADNVVVMTDLAKKSYSNFLAYPDDEHRVFYVATTRAQERLIIMEPQTPRHFAL